MNFQIRLYHYTMQEGWKRANTYASFCISVDLAVQGEVTFQEIGHISKLRDFVLPVAALSLQLLQAIQELSAGESRIDGAQSPVHFSPDEI